MEVDADGSCLTMSGSDAESADAAVDDTARARSPAAKAAPSPAGAAKKGAGARISTTQRHKAAGGAKGKRWCRGCKCWKLSTEFAANQALDFGCKRNRENLYRIAKRQKMLDWFSKCEADDQQFFVMLNNYVDRCPMEQESGKRARGKIVCAVMKQVVEAATETLHDDVGEMMCEPEFVEWSKTPRGGMLDSIQAKRRRDDMVVSKDTMKLIYNNDCPDKYP